MIPYNIVARERELRQCPNSKQNFNLLQGGIGRCSAAATLKGICLGVFVVRCFGQYSERISKVFKKLYKATRILGHITVLR